MDYGKAIRMARTAKGFSQSDLAKKLGFAPSYISRLEAGSRKPTMETMESIADKLHIPLYLLILLSSDKRDIKGLPSNIMSDLGVNLLNLVVE
jgi:transcriptional regulator with XRE-family HTH domain